MISNFQILQTLIIRDLMSRFGRNHLGFFWAILEPMILTAGVMIVWSLIKEPTVHGIPVITFVLTGYMPVTLWRHMTNPMMRILRSNSGLLYHRPISHIHLLIARDCLELLSTTAALGVIYFVVVSVGLVEPVENLGIALGAWLFIAWYFGAIGLLIAALTEYWEPAEKFIQPLQYLALPLSGMFFMVDWLPASAQHLLLLNPTIHCFEMFRAGVLGEAIPTHYNVWYLGTWSAILTFMAVAAVYRVRDRIRFS